MAKYIYVDNSNVFIEGKRVSAVKKGLALNIYEAMNQKILDNSYRIDFGSLHNLLVGTDATKKVVLFGSRPPQNDTVWAIARSKGFQTIIEDRNIMNKEKKIDTGIAVKMTRDAYKECVPNKDTIVLVAGDSDFVPAVQEITGDGINIVVAFWGHASNELIKSASKYINLDDYIDTIEYKGV